MNVRELTAALERAGVDGSRYWVHGQAFRPGAPPAEDQVRLGLNLGVWEVSGGGEVVPGWEGTLRRFASQTEACEVFLRELTRTDRPAFAREKAAWVVEAARIRQEGEDEIAADEPELAADRAWWAREWRRREAAGEPAMTCAELDQALRKAGPGRRARYRIVGLDAASDGPGTVIDSDDQGRWYAGFWRQEYPYYLIKEVRFASEGELCKYVYDDATGPWTAPPPLTLEQWRRQRELRVEQRAEQDRRYEEAYGRPATRPDA